MIPSQVRILYSYLSNNGFLRPDLVVPHVPTTLPTFDPSKDSYIFCVVSFGSYRYFFFCKLSLHR